MIDKAKQDAYLEIKSLRIEINISKCEEIFIKDNDLNVIENLEDLNSTSITFESDETFLRSSDVHNETDNTNLVKDLSILSNVTGSLELKKYDKCKVKIDPISEFIVERQRE